MCLVPDDVKIQYFKLWLFGPEFIVLNIKGLLH